MKKTSVFGLIALALMGCEQTYEKTLTWEELNLSQIEEMALFEDMSRFCKDPKGGLVAGRSVNFSEACQAFLKSPTLAQFKERFIPTHLVKKEYIFFEKPVAKATAYYTPLLKGSYEKKGAYQVPIRKKPKDMVTIDTSLFDKASKERWIGMVKNNKVVPYLERAEIEAGTSGGVIVYTDSLIDKFFLQVQGSGYVAFENGEKKLLRFAAHNGRPYTSIGRELVKAGVFSVEDANMFSIRSWLKNHQDEQINLLNKNPRYIFFDWGKEVTGASGRTLEAYRSAAIDPKTMSYGLPFVLKTEETFSKQEKTYVLRADDTGGAIVGVGRVDIYAGEGEMAEKVAAYQNSTGEMVVFLPRPL